MRASEFIARFSRANLLSWEAMAVELAREDASRSTQNLTPWLWSTVTLVDGPNTAVLHVMSDVLSIGPVGDHLRLPLTPTSAQEICDAFGWILPTPWLVYQLWRSTPRKLEPVSEVPNKGANLLQYFDHSKAIDEQLLAFRGDRPDSPVAGIKKHVVVSNIYRPAKVLIFGWYRPDGPDVFSDKLPMGATGRQPIQPKSNVHGDFYVDYSHGIQPVHGIAHVNGIPMPTEALYRHPTLSRLVSNEGPLKMTRYPTQQAPMVS